MLGLVMSLVVAVPAAFPSSSSPVFTCDSNLGPASCEGTPRPTADAPDADGAQYATEAVIDCPTPPAADGWAGECDGTPRDASYRASRDPDSERLPGSLRPARRDHGPAGMRAACAGVPFEGRDGLRSPTPLQPLALFAVPGLYSFASSRFSFDSPAALTTRGIRPLERPPRG
jgi:hypothetical protein